MQKVIFGRTFFTVMLGIFILSTYFIYQLMHNIVLLKDKKIHVKTAPPCFGLITIKRERDI
jgi:hypothetical protein